MKKMEYNNMYRKNKQNAETHKLITKIIQGNKTERKSKK
jgi:hypothetical protein